MPTRQERVVVELREVVEGNEAGLPESLDTMADRFIRSTDRTAWAFWRDLDVSQRRAWELAGPLVEVSQSSVSRILREMDRRIFTAEFDAGPDVADDPDDLAGEPPLYSRQQLDVLRASTARYLVDKYTIYRLAEPNHSLPPELEGRFPELTPVSAAGTVGTR